MWLHRVTNTCLCTGHEVSFGFDDGDGILLDRSRSGVPTQSDVSHDNLTQVNILELHRTKECIIRNSRRMRYCCLLNKSSLHFQCGEGSCVLWPQQECHHTSQS